MPCLEEVEAFFLQFAEDMRNEGQFIMDDYTTEWPGLPTKDELREVNVEDQESEEELF